MTRFGIFNTLYIAGFALIGFMVLYGHTSYLSLLFLVLTYILVLVLGAMFISLDFYMDNENAGDARFNEIAITFDDGPHEKFTPLVLDKLNKFGVKASFFCKGTNVVEQANLINEIHTQGHLIGNHSYHHLNKFPILPLVDMKAELEKTNQAIYNHIGLKPIFFRPPFGVTNPRLKKAVDALKMKSIGWSLRTYDTAKPPEKVINKIRKSLSGGDIVLLHDNHHGVLEILDFLIPYAEENGLKIVPLDELLKIKAYENHI